MDKSAGARSHHTNVITGNALQSIYADILTPTNCDLRSARSFENLGRKVRQGYYLVGLSAATAHEYSRQQLIGLFGMQAILLLSSSRWESSTILLPSSRLLLLVATKMEGDFVFASTGMIRACTWSAFVRWYNLSRNQNYRMIASILGVGKSDK
jgi:hypothetical protein